MGFPLFMEATMEFFVKGSCSRNVSECGEDLPKGLSSQ